MAQKNELRVKASGPSPHDVRVFLGDKDVTSALAVSKIEWSADPRRENAMVLTVACSRLDAVGPAEIVLDDGRVIERVVFPDGMAWERGPPEDRGQRGMGASEFARLVLHGDQEHQCWLLDAADAYQQRKPIPPPRGSDNDGLLAEQERALEAQRARAEGLSRDLREAQGRIAEMEAKVARLAAANLQEREWKSREICRAEAAERRLTAARELLERADDRLGALGDTLCHPVRRDLYPWARGPPARSKEDGA